MGPTTTLWISAWLVFVVQWHLPSLWSSKHEARHGFLAPGSRGGRGRVNFAFSEEQEELRKSVRRFLEDKSPETEVRRLMETDRGLRPGGVDPDGRAARPAGPGHPRGVRGVRLQLRRADRRARGDGPGPAVRPLLLDAWRWPPTPCSSPATSRPRRSYLPGIAVGRDHRHRGASPRRRDAGTRQGVTVTATGSGDDWTARRREDVRPRRPHRRPDPGGRPHRRPGCRCSRSTATPRASPAPPLSTMDQTRKQARLELRRRRRPG